MRSCPQRCVVIAKKLMSFTMIWRHVPIAVKSTIRNAGTCMPHKLWLSSFSRNRNSSRINNCSLPTIGYRNRATNVA